MRMTTSQKLQRVHQFGIGPFAPIGPIVGKLSYRPKSGIATFSLGYSDLDCGQKTQSPLSANMRGWPLYPVPICPPSSWRFSPQL